MLISAFIVLALLGLCVGIVLWLVRRSPEGHEDGQAFYFGSIEQPASPPAAPEPKLAAAKSLKAPAV